MHKKQFYKIKDTSFKNLKLLFMTNSNYKFSILGGHLKGGSVAYFQNKCLKVSFYDKDFVKNINKIDKLNDISVELILNILKTAIIYNCDFYINHGRNQFIIYGNKEEEYTFDFKEMLVDMTNIYLI